ncbi:15187_t:CDS:2 [Cetraspora pellucida]|uniref:RING-type E3 ubiquitin transferase (cysteine targeting) n=1 Tax=Cetraspora pellucida TaxID=1433469 RepID=A0A9N9JTX9_9GLOM|nr:15187_t:CDS:2 [Cetraspora pellucida]
MFSYKFPPPPLRIMRSSQLDSSLLDLQLFEILKGQLWKTFSLFKPQFREVFEPELLAALQLIMYRLSIYESGASYGAQLQNLKYRNERQHSGGFQSTRNDAALTKSQKYAFGAMTIGGPYVWMRINRLMTAKRWSELDDSQTFDFLPAHICAICYEQQMSTSALSNTAVSTTRLHNSYETNCGHQYCYYCIRTKMIQEGVTWKCLRCGEEVKEIRRTLDKDDDQLRNDRLFDLFDRD